MKNKYLKFSCLSLFMLITICFFCVGGYYLWINYKQQPKSVEEKLFEGVEYVRNVRSSPRNIVIHIIKIDLRANGIRFLVTPGNNQTDLPLSARTTSEFLREFGLQIAINGDGFTPWRSNSILDYYPHSGDLVNPIGLAVSEGNLYSNDTDNEPTLYISASNRARINSQIGGLFNAISGNLTLVRNGKPTPNLDQENPDPRTAVALDRANRHLLLFVVDGRQPGYSDGTTLEELSEIIIHHGGHNAINLDGGGSSTMVVESNLGLPKVINSPINNGISGRQRPVGNHLGIFAKTQKQP
jgi:exopolysaccharide biosynthesis protein